MNKTFTVFLYELKAAIRTKSFIFTSLFIIFGIVIGSLILRAISSGGVENSPLKDFVPTSQEERLKDTNIAVYNEKDNKVSLDKIFPGAKLVEENSRENLEKAIENQKVEFGLVITSDQEYELVYYIAPTLPSDAMDLEEGLRTLYVNDKIKDKGISLEDIKKIENEFNINTKVTSLKGNNMMTIPVAMFISVVLYMLIIINGQIASMNVAREKNDRTMELLITSTNPSYLINGKVLASFVQSILTLLAIVVGGLIAYLINKDLIGSMLTNISFNIDPLVVVIAICYFIAGYILYLYIYAALGATVSTTEEINSAVAPVMIIVVAVYFAAIAALSNPNPDNLLLKILSFIPFSSMFTMHARYALTSVPLVEIAISFGILLVTTIILSVFCVKLYRKASLNYGNENKLINRLKKSSSKKNK